MLSFFRKYQRVIFLFTTVIVIASFTFFGTMSSMGDSSQGKEEHLVRAIDGSSISLQKVDRMVQFISSSQLDLKDDHIQFVNLLNEGVLEKDFLGSVLGGLLAEKVFPQIEKDMKTTIEKIGQFHPYRHSQAPFITTESVWAQFSPESAEISRKIAMSSSSVTVKTFDLLSKAYLQHQMVPSTFIRRVLAYQEGQASQTEKDSSLPYADVSLFGLHSAKAWLGETYIKAAAQVILNASAYAKRQGYSLSTQEARKELIAQTKEAVNMVSKEVNPQTDFYQVFLSQVRKLGMNEMECIDLWRDIALFRKVFKASADDLVIDPSEFPELQVVARDQALIEKFSLPVYLQLRDFSSLMKLQLYVDAVGSPKGRSKESLGTLPSEFISLAEVEKKAPDLVQREYVLEYAELDLKKAASQVGLKETWSWQTQDAGWIALKKQYPVLANNESKTKEARFAALEGLDQKIRLEMDKFSREQILSSDVSRVKALLENSSKETKSIATSSKGFELPFKGVQDMASLVALLETSALKGDSEAGSLALATQEKISFYTGDDQHYYSIHVVSRSPLKKIQTFEEANSSGSLRRMLEKKLEDSYFEVRKRDSLTYMQKDGSWKPLSEVKDKVGLAVFAASLKNIAAQYASFTGKEPTASQIESPEFYVQNWMIPHMKKSLESAKLGTLEKKEGRLEGQWQLVQEKETIERNQNALFASQTFEEGSWSSILSLSPGKSSFFNVLQKLSSAPLTVAEIEKATAPLRQEAFKKFSVQLLNEIESKQALVLLESL